MPKTAMNNTLFAYCIFCDHRCHDNIVAILEKQYNLKAFSPKVTNHKKINGAIEVVMEYFLQGYVFVFSEKEISDWDFIYRISGVYKLLGRKENNCCLEGNDRTFALELEKLNGVIGRIKVWKSKDDMGIADESFSKASNARIIKLDSRKKRARVEFSFNDMKFSVWAAVELETK